MAEVSLLQCDTYSLPILKEKVSEGLRNIGYDPAHFRNLRVALKPNILTPSQPEKAVTTHPLFFRAVAEIVLDHGGYPRLVECPAIAPLRKAIKSSGYLDVVEDLDIEVADGNATEVLQYGNAKTYKRIGISRSLFEVDLILNLPKLKTHGLTYFTGAVKNLFGTIPGLEKSRMHMKQPSKEDFSDFLLDLYGGFYHGFERPVNLMHIMDAVVGMEGEGPGPSGKPRKIGAIIVGEDGIAVDWVAINLVGLEEQKVCTITSGFERDFGVKSGGEINVIGASLEDMRMEDFAPSKGTFRSNMMRGPLTSKTVKNLFVEKPVPQEGKCTLCYQCKIICPANAINKSDNKKKIPAYDYKKCIRCLCCMEICPEAAITLKRGRLQWIMKEPG